ncbi:MAG: hypothetical protein QM706_06835, partial [Nitrospira sp.]
MSKIMIVDDSYAELQLIESYLKAAQHTVVSFSTADGLEDKIVSEKGAVRILSCFPINLSNT